MDRASRGGILQARGESHAVFACLRGSEESALAGSTGFQIACRRDEDYLQITGCGALQVCDYLLILSLLGRSLVGRLRNAGTSLLELRGRDEGGVGKETHAASYRRKSACSCLRIHLLHLLLVFGLVQRVKRDMSVR